MYEKFLLCVITIAFSALAHISIANVTVQVSHLSDRSPPLMNAAFKIQTKKDEIIMQATNLFRATFQSPGESASVIGSCRRSPMLAFLVMTSQTIEIVYVFFDNHNHKLLLSYTPNVE